MRWLLPPVVAGLLVGCTGPPSDGSLWNLQAQEQERATFRLTDEQRRQQARAYELALADAMLEGERQRLEAQLQACPGPSRVPLAVSPANRTRDAIRVRIGSHAERLTEVAQLALADWRLRRAGATGDAAHCQAGRDALVLTSVPSTAGPVLHDTDATVARGTNVARAVEGEPALRMLSEYALGWTDAVRAPVPLPHHLAAVYGGVASAYAPATRPSDRAAEDVVDELAPQLPMWEPDALWQWLQTTPG
jgi:hypothetical protein